jgi:hypothetical protein
MNRQWSLLEGDSMTTTSKRKRFLVCTDDGKELWAVEIQHWERIAPLYEEPELIPTVCEFKLANGKSLNRIDDDTFEVVGTGERLRRKR